MYLQMVPMNEVCEYARHHLPWFAFQLSRSSCFWLISFTLGIWPLFNYCNYSFTLHPSFPHTQNNHKCFAFNRSEYEVSYKEIGENTNGPAATLFIYNPFKRYEAWRFVTYMFVHVGVMHIMMNLIIQIFLGVALELVHHWWRVALVYLAGKISYARRSPY